MSTSYWGINMYGVDADDLNFKPKKELLKLPAIKSYLKENDIKEEEFDFDDYMSEHVFDGCNETSEKSPRGKLVCIGYCRTNGDKKYFGLHAGYPWEEYIEGVTKEDVKEATWAILKDYLDMSDEEFFEHFGVIIDTDWG